MAPQRRQADRPWIGITTYHREREGRSRFTLPDAYVEGVRQAGGRALLIAPGEAEPAALLERLDGLLLTGGGDLHPELLGEPAHGHMYAMCAERDRFELSLVGACLERGTPLLAICRGLQVLNVALGGDLHLHLPDVVGEGTPHRKSQDEPTSHAVRMENGSHLHELLGGRLDEPVASWHHQGVRRPGRGLAATAWAEDGTVEALRLDGAPQVLAVQWHPELQLEPDSPQHALFQHLVRTAAQQTV